MILAWASPFKWAVQVSCGEISSSHIAQQMSHPNLQLTISVWMFIYLFIYVFIKIYLYMVSTY